MISTDKMRAKLRDAVKKAGGQKHWAHANGVSPQYVCDCLKGRREIGEGISRPLGYVPITVYVPAEGS